jgi:hypothetical protein
VTATERLRALVKAKMGNHVCPSCGGEHSAMALRDVTALTGVSASTLSRFLNGKGIDSETFDALDAWTREEARP